ncbi:uncharacterized protein LOC117218002 isoform X1 [Megalopta genalis]|uniref:uncharacterized protein LOC117218002 isoform X1 n=2 Tax=Megalopta genalis TaxID=115081 RepID=UPI0014437B91|nr:uncharacterized protein LOC117218002 isoform X1 [Megalopta genalis]
MQKLIYVLLFAGLTMLAEAGHEVCKRCNSTYMVSKRSPRMNSQYLYHPSHPLSAFFELSSLPEEEHAEDQVLRQVGQQPLDRGKKNLLPEYRDLCEIITKRVQLDDLEYEYQPPQYYEVYCKNYPFVGNDQAAVKSKQECVNPGFHCVQRSKTLFLVRRRWDSECWEPYSKEIASGCDCMWPVSALGDIAVHY